MTRTLHIGAQWKGVGSLNLGLQPVDLKYQKLKITTVGMLKSIFLEFDYRNIFFSYYF